MIYNANTSLKKNKMFMMVYYPESSWCLEDVPDPPDDILKWFRQIHWVCLTNYNMIYNTYIYLLNWKIPSGYPLGSLPCLKGRSWYDGDHELQVVPIWCPRLYFSFGKGLGLIPSSTFEISEWLMMSDDVILWWQTPKQYTHCHF